MIIGIHEIVVNKSEFQMEMTILIVNPKNPNTCL